MQVSIAVDSNATKSEKGGVAPSLSNERAAVRLRQGPRRRAFERVMSEGWRRVGFVPRGDERNASQSRA